MISEFIAYAGDCRVQGKIDVAPDARLSDYLNDVEVVVVRDAELTSHDDGHVVHLAEVSLDRSDLFAVEAVGPRGASNQRIHLVRHRLQVRIGPYMVLGQLHAFPGSDPLAAISRRSPMIPLTIATIAFDGGIGVEAHDVETLIVNRGLVDWVRMDDIGTVLPGFRVPAASRARSGT